MTENKTDEEFDDEEAISGNDEGHFDFGDSQRQAIMQPKDVTLFQYHRWKQQGRLNLNPDWQRDYVWKGKRPSLLIESLFMQIPIPVIFLSRTIDGGYEVIDGVQRLTTVFHFFDDKFRLRELEVFKELNSKRFSELDRDQQSRLEDAVITCFELSENTPQDLLFATFERINTGGMRLNEMEIRNCIYRGRLNDKIRDLAKNADFHLCMNVKNISDRMLDRNMVLRFLAFDEVKYEKASSGLKSFVNRFFETYRNPSDAVLNGFEKRFKRAMRNCVTVFGSHAFRLRRTDSKGGGEWAPKPNASIFQVIATSLAAYEHIEITRKRDQIFEEYLDILHDQRWLDAVTKATGDATNIRYAFSTWHSRLSSLMQYSEALDSERTFSSRLKQELFEQGPTCQICGGQIKLINDAALDHIDQYWRGGKTIPSNARLVHRSCNLARSKAD